MRLKADPRFASKRSLDLQAEYNEYFDEVVLSRIDRSGNRLSAWTRGDERFFTSRLDYAFDADPPEARP